MNTEGFIKYDTFRLSGLGDYDIDVMTYALQKHQLSVSWHDRR